MKKSKMFILILDGSKNCMRHIKHTDNKLNKVLIFDFKRNCNKTFKYK